MNINLRTPFRYRIEKNVRTQRSSIVLKSRKIPALPPFPLESAEIAEQATIRKKLEFLEIGPLSFIDELGPKGKEGYVWRRYGFRNRCLATVTKPCVEICPCWSKRWLFMKVDFVGLLNPHSGQIENVLLLDQAFRVRSGGGRSKSKMGILIQNLNKKLYVKCESEYEVESWIIEFNMMVRKSADFVRPNRFNSYALVRPLSECRWIVDGATYFEAVAQILMKAKEEIFIADWWLSPEIYLKRPTLQGHYWQLDHVLRTKAREGVRIYILLYKELNVALGIDSQHTSKKLSRMHRNIKVIRHPEVSEGVWLWAHHEKIVCVDQTYAFVGGIDLCYGRWDDYQHRLCDIGDVMVKSKAMRHMSTAVPSDVPNIPNIRRSISDPSVSTSKKEIEFVSEKQLEKAARFRIAAEKLNAAQRFDKIRRKLLMEAKEDFASTQKATAEHFPQLSDRRRTLKETALIDLGVEKKYRLWHGKDYANFIWKDFENLNEPYSGTIRTGYMIEDIQENLSGETTFRSTLKCSLTEKSNYHKDNAYNYLLPKSYNNLGDHVPSVLHDTLGSIFWAECQVLRSLCKWSGGVKQIENSIHEAYIETIQEAKHFIYIENQFFITQPASERSVHNGIADALFNRIIKAYRKRESFHVYIVLPLLPAFQGTLGTGTGTCIQAITHWNNASIGGGHSSLIHRLARHMKDPSLYINFYGLRTHGFLRTKLVTELIYVHSKLLIADDQVAIIGSANINDRSLLGNRDSEIAVVVRDTQFLKEEEGRPHQAGKFCYSLRTALFREHLGMLQDTSISFDLNNPSNEEFFRNVWSKIAEQNTSIYEKVFLCIPTDSVRTFRQLREYQSRRPLAATDPAKAMAELKSIRGYLVKFPLYFLRDEYLQPTISTKERYLPTAVWT
nr:phospholipase D2 [Parasteatoda tepidariorum]